MRLTIKMQLFGLTISGLAFVAGVSATGYWGIKSVEHSATEVASTGSAIRNHIEAGIYNDLTRTDTSAVFTAKGDEQQNQAEEFSQHSKLLQGRIAKARELATDPASRAMLDDEIQLSARYVTAGNTLIAAIIHNPGAAPPLLGPYLQMYKELQGKIEQTSDQLGKSAQQAELIAAKNSSRATRAMFLMCASSLLILFLGSFILVRGIAGSLRRLTEMIQDIAEGEGDVTKRIEAASHFAHDEIGEVSRLFNLFMDKLQGILRGVVGHTHKLTSASQQLLDASAQITANSRDTAAQSNSVARVTQLVDQNLQGLATGAGEMKHTIESIAANANEAARVANSAVAAAQAADATVAKLGQSSTEIGVVIKVITSIAQQTNLLALNATIEAARAGEAGKGFAVVANEVKELAKGTARATEDISRKIAAIQTDTKSAVAAIATVSGVIDQVNAISATIAAAVEEQSATTDEMIRNTREAASGATDITTNIGGVATAADGTLARAQESQQAAQDLTSIALEISGLMRQFKIERQDQRFKISVPVHLTAETVDGHPLNQEVTTVNVSQRGALLRGVRGTLKLGSFISLSRSHKQERYLVAWVAEENSSRAGEIGVSAVDPSTSFWNDVIEKSRRGEPNASAEPATEKLLVRAQGA